MALVLRACLAAMAVLIVAQAGAAEPKPAPLDERLFALYALEDFYCRSPTFSPATASDPTGQATIADVAGFFAQRQFKFDLLRRHFEKQKDGDPKLLERFADCERWLAICNDFRGKLLAANDAYRRTLGLRQFQAQQRAMNAALMFGLATYFDGASGGESIFAGLLRGAQTAQVEQAKLNRAQIAALAQRDKEIQQAVKELLAQKFHEVRKQNLAAVKKTAEELRGQYSWEDVEFASFSIDRRLITGGTPSASYNPFKMADTASEILKKKTDASKEELTDQANICLRAVAMVPLAKNFHAYRAHFLGVAGRLANKAAAKDIGTTGFSDAIKNVPKAGPLALWIWQQYVKNEKIDTNVTDEVIHHYLLACCYAGKPATAYVLIANNCTQLVPRGRPPLQLRFTVSNKNDFWYDCARVCSMKGDPIFALNCLQQAKRLGYGDNEAAKVDPDLKTVRENRLTRDAFQRFFP